MKTKSKEKKIFIITFGIISSAFLLYGTGILKINFFHVLKIIFQHLNSTDPLHYGTIGIGTTILITSLAGLGIIIPSYFAIKKIHASRIFLYISFISFIYSILFSIMKLLVYIPKDNSTYVIPLGNLCFICFAVGVLSLIVSFIFLILKLSKIYKITPKQITTNETQN